MKLIEWLQRWNLESLKVSAGFLDLNINFKNADRAAAWDMYIELLTRITTQPLDEETGDEVSALSSLHSLFATTRDIIKKNGPECIEFSKIAIVILNQVVRPFTSKWHKAQLEGKLTEKSNRKQFRKELAVVQQKLHSYTSMLSEIAGVENLVKLEATE